MEPIDFESAVERMRRMPTPEGYREPVKYRKPLDVLAEMGVPRRVIRCLSDGVKDTTATNRVESWVAKYKPEHLWAIALAAPVGAGKTIAAGHWLMLLNLEVPASRTSSKPCWLPSPELAVMDSFGDEFRQYKASPYLVIDDLGTEFMGMSGAFESKLDALINARYSNELPTLITTNQNAADFRARASQRLVSRLRDGGTWAEFPGESMR